MPFPSQRIKPGRDIHLQPIPFLQILHIYIVLHAVMFAPKDNTPMGLKWKPTETCEELISRNKNIYGISGCLDSAGAAVRDCFQVVTTTLLSLLLPLSCLLLARLSTANYLREVAKSYNYPQIQADSFLSAFFLYAKSPKILDLMVSFITTSSLFHAVTGTIVSSDPLSRPRVYAAWICLCFFQVCVGLGIQGSIETGIDGSGFGRESSFLCRTIFFFGLHETTLFWSRTVVKSVVDDTLFGDYQKERSAQKVVTGLSYGCLWWWCLRDEVESLVAVPKLKMEMEMRIGVADFVGWWLYYMMVVIGAVRVVRGLVFPVRILLSRRREEEERRRTNDHKV